MIIHSIKWRLQAWHGFLLVCLVAGLMTGFYTFERRARWQAIDNDLHEAMTPLLPKLAPPGPRGLGERSPDERGRRPPPPEDDGPFPPDQHPLEDRGRSLNPPGSDKVYYAAWSGDGRQIAISANAPGDIPFPKFANSKETSSVRTRGANRELAYLVRDSTCVLVGTSLATVLAELRKLALALGVIGCAIVLAGLTVGWWLAGRALRPIAEISHAAREIAAGDLSRRINASEAESELGQLATVLNSTFARLDAAFARQQQFTSDAAHELRTPVSVILTQTQGILSKERSPAEYRETLEACQRAAQRMRRLTESLLELARLDARQETMKRKPLDLADTGRDCVALIQPLAIARQITIHTEFAPAVCLGDRDRLALVITNLLTNAIHHNQDGGEIRVTTRKGQGGVILSVADNGPGIAAEHLPHIFERFYRVDSARTSSQGRSGLGLAISKAIMEVHGETIEVAGESNGGTTFTLWLPTS